MKIRFSINEELIAKAKEVSGIQNENILIEKALQLFVTIENQKKLKDLFGKIEFDKEAFK